MRTSTSHRALSAHTSTSSRQHGWPSRLAPVPILLAIGCAPLPPELGAEPAPDAPEVVSAPVVPESRKCPDVPPYAESSAYAVIADVRYGTTSEEAMDLVLPSARSSSRPTIVYIHGGGWAEGDKRCARGLATHLAERGFAVANINYRLADPAVPSSAWPAQLQDVQLAVRTLRARSAELGLDPARICAMGDSAGGHLAAMLGVMTRTQPGDRSAILPQHASSVTCVVDLYGPTDLAQFFANLPPPALFGGQPPSRAPSVYAEASPLNAVTAASAPMLIAHGVRDPLVPTSHSAALDNRLRAHGVESRLLLFPGEHSLGASFEQVMGEVRSFVWATALPGGPRRCRLAEHGRASLTVERQVEYVYCLALGRTADPGGRAGYAAELRAGRLSPLGLLRVALASPEFERRFAAGPGLGVSSMSNADFVRLVVAVLLQREVDAPTLTTLTSWLDQGQPRARVIEVLTSDTDPAGREFHAKHPVLSGPTSPSPRGALFVGQRIPTHLRAGQLFSATVTMRNIGSAAWGRATRDALGAQAPQDTRTWGPGRVQLDPTEHVAAGADKTFRLELRAPTTPGTYTFQWGMVRDGVEWFGDRTPAVSIAVGP